ncbi:hypothetical protein KMC72_gp37 [Paenibacillus phage Dragolir]|uniref:Uncharacterized protein n=1 Tax=Paenibacillus phage Dragolir TaxID=2070190 RepID=A0A2I7SC44_9CAUD|nr:hypothetical protein KMC72_gp37 [Paenibacillus phage Dragolir]AUS03470.1 hypothetical protein DRAGOLIR_37 [Paenibacillus phage Dragolir]
MYVDILGARVHLDRVGGVSHWKFNSSLQNNGKSLVYQGFSPFLRTF